SASSEKAPASPEPASASAASSESTAVPSNGSWQAIFAPQYNAYYFYNSETKETTWENPIIPSAASETPAVAGPSTAEEEPETPQASTSTLSSLQQAAIAQGIDPSLAYLDPSLADPASTTSTAGSFTAKFNARTGQFARPDARDPSHMSEYERAKRMSEFYFDVGAWEKQKAQDDADEAGKKRKRPTKKDLERFKEQKRLKKIAKTAWLRT
ncbi:hypothetical protein C8J56DRAFT_749627, partial [Mycena floridula]